MLLSQNQKNSSYKSLFYYPSLLPFGHYWKLLDCPLWK